MLVVCGLLLLALSVSVRDCGAISSYAPYSSSPLIIRDVSQRDMAKCGNITNGQPRPVNTIPRGTHPPIQRNLSSFQNGSLALVPLCNVTKCGEPKSCDQNLSPSSKRLAKRILEDVTCNANLIPPDARNAYNRTVNEWYVRTRNRNGNVRLQVAEQHLITVAPDFIEAPDLWQVSFVISPWLLREFARVNRCNAQAGDRADMEDLENLLSFHEQGDPRPPDALTAFFHDPTRNMFGADSRVVYLREMGLALGAGMNYRAPPINADNDEIRVMFRLSRFSLDQDWEYAVRDLESFLEEHYQNSQGRIGRAFREYMTQLRRNMEDAAYRQIEGDPNVLDFSSDDETASDESEPDIWANGNAAEMDVFMTGASMVLNI